MEKIHSVPGLQWTGKHKRRPLGELSVTFFTGLFKILAPYKPFCIHNLIKCSQPWWNKFLDGIGYGEVVVTLKEQQIILSIKQTIKVQDGKRVQNLPSWQNPMLWLSSKDFIQKSTISKTFTLQSQKFLLQQLFSAQAQVVESVTIFPRRDCCSHRTRGIGIRWYLPVGKGEKTWKMILYGGGGLSDIFN